MLRNSVFRWCRRGGLSPGCHKVGRFATHIRTLTLLSSSSSDGGFQRDNGRHNWMAAAVVTLALTGGVLYDNNNYYPGSTARPGVTQCCGIVGVVGETTGSCDARSFLLDGLTILKNRGFDSAGLATMSANGGPMAITKFASETDTSNSIDLVRANSKDSSHGHCMGIAHTRWATHGSKTDANAHPHTDSSGKIAIVHNGALNNANELRRELTQMGHSFTSQTDSEVIAKLIGYYYDGKCTLKEATEKALARCDGTWGLAVMCVDTPNQLVVASNGSPMVLGVGDGQTYVASEPEAFASRTKNFITMNDGEIAVLHADGKSLDLSRVETRPDDDDEEIKISPEPFPHWSLKEIMEQPEAIGRALAFGGRIGYDRIHLGGLDDSYQRLRQIKHLLMLGCATSLNAAKYGELIMKYLGSLESVHAMDASEFEEKDLPCPDNLEGTGLLVLSQSGETKDVVNAVNLAMEAGVKTMSVVNSVGSTIARLTKLGVYCNAGRENAVASTKSFTSQVTVLALVSLWFRQIRSPESPEATRLKEALMRLPLSFGGALKTHEQCKRIAQSITGKEHCFVLGKGFGEPVAMEGALKIKEFSYMHAEGYSGGALKHGPFALIEGEEGKFGATPVIMLILDDQHAHHMRTAAEEVRARGAQVIIITDKFQLADGLDDDPIVIPTNGPLTALGAVVPLQLLAYEIAVARGINPDTPRNLAKAVLVN